MNGFRFYAASAIITAVVATIAPAAKGQGCVVARSNGEIGGPASEGGYLAPGEFNVGVDYRHQFSFRHFIGPTEQTQRVAQGTQVENKINLENLNVTYQMTRRFSVTANLPILTASRHSNNTNVFQLSDGIGDTSFLASGWLWNPTENTRGNVELGIGFQLPTGKDNVTTLENTAKGPVTVTNDYSVQPGSGGYGIIFQWSSYKNVKATQLYFNGSYLATPQNTNNVLRSATAANQPLTQFNSISDQYLLQAGIAVPVHQVPGLTITFGPRFEGVPANDLIGDSLGFRRPGFALSVEPGVQYYHGGSTLVFSVAAAVYRDRTKSVPDTMLGTHGDAAFADYVWLASYSYRFDPFHRHHEMPPKPDQSSARAELRPVQTPVAAESACS